MEKSKTMVGKLAMAIVLSLLLLAGIAFGVPTGRAYAEENIDLTDGLAGWWKLNEGKGKIAENLGENKEGADRDGEIQPQWIYDEETYGNMLQFEGTPFVKISQPKFHISEGFSVAMWMRGNVENRREYQILFAVNMKGAGHIEVTINRETGELYLFANDLTAKKTGDSDLDPETPITNVDDGNWHHIAIVHTTPVENGVNDWGEPVYESQLCYYVDGELISAVDVLGFIDDMYEDEVMASIGALVERTYGFVGNILDVRLYEKPISAEAVALLAETEPEKTEKPEGGGDILDDGGDTDNDQDDEKNDGEIGIGGNEETSGCGSTVSYGSLLACAAVLVPCTVALYVFRRKERK